MTDEELRRAYEEMYGTGSKSWHKDFERAGAFFDGFANEKNRRPPRSRRICGELVEDTDGVYRVKAGSENEPF